MSAKTHKEKVKNNRILIIDEAIRSDRYQPLPYLAGKTEENTAH
jgi:hypothetical protein